MALLDMMIVYGLEHGLPVEAVTVDHGLRPEAADEAESVSRFCAARGVPHSTLQWNRAVESGNLQAEAREARYSMIADWARARGIDCVALGHTMDDQAETFLMRLARKAGVDGLAAMDAQFERNGIRWIRPLLGRSRAELREYLENRSIAWIEDPSNENRQFERIRARDALSALSGLGIDAEALSDVSHQLAAARQALNYYAVQEATRIVAEDHGDILLTGYRQPSVPDEIKRRLLVSALQWVGGLTYPPRRSALAELEIALGGEARTHTLGGCILSLSVSAGEHDAGLRISREYNAVKSIHCPTDQMWDGRWKLDGPHAADLEIRALGDAVKDCPEWRETGRPRTSLLSSPAVWRGDQLIAAPVAGFLNGWTASATGRGSFTQFLLSR